MGFEEKLRNRANTGSSLMTGKRLSTVEESMFVHQTLPSSQTPLDNQEEFSVQQDMDTVEHEEVTDSLFNPTSFFGRRSRFPDACDDIDASNRGVPDIEQQQDIPGHIPEMRSRFYSNDSNSLIRIRLESFDQNAFSDNADIESPSDFPTSVPDYGARK